MKTTNLICNVCKKTEVIESSPYGPPMPAPGWSHVSVMQMREAPPRRASPFVKAFGSLAKEAEGADQDNVARAFRNLAENFQEEDHGEGYAMPSQQSADICPTCAPKALGSLLPHLTSDHGPASTMLVGAR